MARIQLFTLGPMQVACDGRPVHFAYEKVAALLVYLAVEAEYAHPRDSLGELLWPERPSTITRHNLSQALTSLRQAFGLPAGPLPFLSLTRERVQFNHAAGCWLDEREFVAALNAVDRHAHPSPELCADCAENLERAADLYRGEFLSGFSLGEAASFEQWLLVKREALRERASQAFARLAEYRAAQGAAEAALRLARRQLELDPWSEPACRQVMRFLALAGQRSAALAEYNRCRQTLLTDLGVEPEAETTTLCERIRTGELVRSESRPASAAAPARRPLPVSATSFVGREAELQALAERCADPACRLISLIGPGGAGKTRLALEAARNQAARNQAPRFAQGVCFVALAPLTAAEHIPAALAEALAFTPYGSEDLRAQLVRYLRPQQLLLLLDNFEHVLAGADFLAEILAGAPGVKLLVTSRERLALSGEWVLNVEGLNVPDGADASHLESYSAVRLFAQSARRAAADFTLTAADRVPVTRLCQLVNGLPLGLELAAAWLPVLSPAEIVQEIEKNLDFLAAELRDLPERHHSLRAVFDQSWRLLTSPERAAFRRLAVLRGSFTREAAEAVAGASLVDLARLTAKSLLHRTAGGRYAIHTLLRQYAETRLREHPDEEQPARERHAAYYLTFLAAREAALKSHLQPATLAEIAAEIENIRAAWDWAMPAGRADLIAAAIDGYWLFTEVRGQYSERVWQFHQAVAALEAAPDQLPGRALALGKALACEGSWHMRLGRPEQLQVLCERSLDWLRPLGAQREIAFTLNMLAAAAHVRGAYAEERRYLRESIALGQAAGDRWITGYSLNDLGLVAFLLGEAGEARRLCAESLALFQAIGDPRGQAFALHNLGLIAGQVADLAEAERLLRQSLALWRRQNHRWGIATTLIRLGTVARAQGAATEARTAWREAVQVGMEIGTWPLVLDGLVELAGLLHQEGAADQAGAVAQAVLAHPAGMASTRRNAERLLAAAGPPLAGGLTVEALVAELLASDELTPAAGL